MDKGPPVRRAADQPEITPMPKKKISTETIEELRKDVQGTLQNVLLNADAFIFRGETSAYPQSTEKMNAWAL